MPTNKNGRPLHHFFTSTRMYVRDKTRKPVPAIVKIKEGLHRFCTQEWDAGMGCRGEDKGEQPQGINEKKLAAVAHTQHTNGANAAAPHTLLMGMTPPCFAPPHRPAAIEHKHTPHTIHRTNKALWDWCLWCTMTRPACRPRCVMTAHQGHSTWGHHVTHMHVPPTAQPVLHPKRPLGSHLFSTHLPP
jgi:hypothetical protein